MAIKKLPTNYADDIIDVSANPHRKYLMTDAGAPDTVYLEDKTEYISKGSNFGANDVNTTNKKINEIITEIENIENGDVNVGKANALATPRYINGMLFDGSKNIENDFILTNQAPLLFGNKLCTIEDARITSNSLADVYFTNDTKSIAEKAVISVETYDGYLQLEAGRTPSGTLVATIRVRVI